jgi:uncharacterized membrane protein YedE/YeeE
VAVSFIVSLLYCLLLLSSLLREWLVFDGVHQRKFVFTVKDNNLSYSAVLHVSICMTIFRHKGRDINTSEMHYNMLEFARFRTFCGCNIGLLCRYFVFCIFLLLQPRCVACY